MDSAGLFALTNMELTRFFFALVLLLIFAHGFGYLFSRFKMPKVIGEIFGGFILGPTLLGFFFPQAYVWIFSAFEEEGKLLSAAYWIGLILLMFVSGFEIQKSIDKGDKKIITAVILGSTIIPFIAGWIAPKFYDFSPYLGPKSNMLALTIEIAIAFAVTSIPVISKIFLDLGIINTRFAKIVLASATMHDVILWVALAIATGLVSGEAISLYKISSTVLITLVFFGIALTVMPKLIGFGNKLRINLLIKSSISGYALIICFLFAAIASIFDVNIIFGAFLAGIVVGLIPDQRFDSAKSNIKDISLAFFVPIYFAIVGLKLDLIRNLDLAFFLGFLALSTLIIIASTVIATKIIGKDWLSSLNLGIAMSTRGGPGIVLATVAFDLGIINENFFTALVLIAIVSSLISGYWFKLILSRGWKLIED